MNDNTRAESGEDLHETESGTEQQFRADFMHAWSSITRDPEGHAPAAVIDYAEYSNRWVSQNDWSDEWAYLSTAAHRWQRNPHRATRELEVNRRILSPIRQRSEEQARYLAEHGIERDEAGLLSSHYVTRVHERDQSVLDQQQDSDAEEAFLRYRTTRTNWEAQHGVVADPRADEEALHNFRTNRAIGVEPVTNASRNSGGAMNPVSSAFAAARTRELAGSGTGSLSPLANHHPGNALAVSMANSERDGMER